MNSIRATIVLAVLSACLGGCAVNHKPRIGAEDPRYPTGDIRADAYLFDAKIKREGKPTSIRLQIYQADTITALSGKGYLGKGVIKGRIRDDSLLVYFPSSEEFLRETIGSVIASSGCPQSVPYVNLSALLSTVPDSLPGIANVEVAPNYGDPDRPQFMIFTPDCPWQLELEYDRHDTGWRLRRFEFDDGNDINIKADRRTFKDNTDISAERFYIVIPDYATRIIP